MFLISTVRMQAAAQPPHYKKKPLGMRLMHYPNVNPVTRLQPNFPHFQPGYSTVDEDVCRKQLFMGPAAFKRRDFYFNSISLIRKLNF